LRANNEFTKHNLELYFRAFAGLWIADGPCRLSVHEGPGRDRGGRLASTTLPAEKEAIIKGRKAIINDFLDMVAGKNMDFSKTHCTEDVEFEDPIEKFVGMKEFNQFVEAYSRYTKDAEIEIYQELHSPHEIVLDIQIKCWFHLLPNYPWVMKQRNHYMLEPPSTKGGSEKVFRIFEEWGGNPLLNEKTATPGFLGKVHSKLRRFTGYLLSMAWQKGLI